ncbi:hypothetical protein AAGW05_13680 [Arthrobacter sp. LAPM80]|uniref:hypothetical protein n=1 Tax=Arthrobacter sp. LAPM80 TaxID=3141788 RepID=UPI00398AF046
MFIPAVYTAADPLLGGRNHAGLLLVIAILAGFWQFHTATVWASFSDEVRRRSHLMRGRLAFAVASTCVIAGFLTSRVEVTNQNLPLAYGNQPGMQLFLWAGSAFIILVCVDITATCLKFLPELRSGTFKSGVGCFAAGCGFMTLALGNRLALGMLEQSAAPNSSGILGSLNWSFSILETLAVLLVSFGLMLPRYHDAMLLFRQDIQSRRLMALLTPLWHRSSHNRKYLLRNRWTPLLDPVTGHVNAHLHRRVIEIRDCQLRGMELCPRDRVLLSRAEDHLIGR